MNSDQILGGAAPLTFQPATRQDAVTSDRLEGLQRKAAMPQGREFGADEIGAALAYIDGLPSNVRRVYMDVKDEHGEWCCVYADERAHAARTLRNMVQGRSFRLRGTDTPQTIQ